MCIRLLGLIVAFASIGAAEARDVDTEALLAKMRSAYRAVKTAKFGLQSRMGSKLYNSEVLYAAPKNVRVEFTVMSGEPPNTIASVVADGEYTELKMSNSPPFRRQPFELDGLERMIPVNLESICFFDGDRQLSTAPGKNMAHSTLRILKNQSWNGRRWLVLEESAPRAQVTCRYYIDPRTFIIWRTTTRKFGEHRDNVDARITRLQTGVTIPPGIFKVP